MPASAIATPHHCNTHHHPLLPTSDSHCYYPPQQTTTDATHRQYQPLQKPTMVGAGSGVHQWLVPMMGGSK